MIRDLAGVPPLSLPTMVYLLGVNLPDDKLTRIALTKFYGIGQATAASICDKVGWLASTLTSISCPL